MKSIIISENIQKILESAVLALGEKFLNEIPNVSFLDLNSASSILQKLVDCYIELKPFSKIESSKTISKDTINSIQTQLNLL